MIRKMFLLNWMYGLQRSRGFKINFSWKSQEKNYTRCIFFAIGPKPWVWLKFTLSSLSSTLIWNTKLVRKVAFSRYFVDQFRNIACSMSQSVTKWCNKNVGPYSGRDHLFYRTYDLEYWFKCIIYLWKLIKITKVTI